MTKSLDQLFKDGWSVTSEMKRYNLVTLENQSGELVGQLDTKTGQWYVYAR